MQTKFIDADTFKKMLSGGAEAIRINIKEINELNVFPVPDGDTGTNMSKTIESGIASVLKGEGNTLAEVAQAFSRGSLFAIKDTSVLNAVVFPTPALEYIRRPLSHILYAS